MISFCSGFAVHFSVLKVSVEIIRIIKTSDFYEVVETSVEVAGDRGTLGGG